MREDEIYRLVPRRRLLAILCNVFGILCVTGAVFLWPTNIPHSHYITLGLGIVAAILLGLGILFHVSDSRRHKGRIRNLERRWSKDEAAAGQAEEAQDGERESEAEDR